MNRRIDWLVVPTLALTMAIAGTTTLLANPLEVQVNPELKPDPLIVRGISGGAKTSNCGNIAATPNQIIQVKQALPYLRLSVESAGQPTLLIDGPGGRFCVLADDYSGSMPEISGYWKPGRYLLYVGDRAQGKHPYTLSISQQKE